MNRRISLRHLRCFVAVAEAESFTVAASRLFLTQSSLTTTIQQFEDVVGLKLFDRNTRRVVMTHEAQRFKIEADYILSRFDNAIGDLQAFAQGRQGQIRIAASISVIEHFLADAVTDFKLAYPNIGISLRDAGAELVESKLLEGEIDFAVTSPHKGLDELSYSPLFADAYGVVCASPHPYSRHDAPLDWAELDPESYIRFTSDTGIGSFLEAKSPRRDLFDRSHDIVSSTSSLYPLLKSGDRYAILPALSATTQAFSGFSFRLLTGPALEREIYLITRRLRSLSPISQKFLELLELTIRGKALPGGVSLRMPRDQDPNPSKGAK
ncbi:LysR family transcriptional regulator [Pollutimonas sp. H1-120]|uniref:LysR family transcriptional regulator n=1 Tax=Pollutimonas sp. H1-120 TaxID=3148824 RepID=UPI003B520A65